MSDLAIMILALLAIGFCLMALFPVLSALFPDRVQRTRQAAAAMPVRSFLLGMVNFLFFGALALLFLALSENIHGIFAFPAFLFLTLLAIGISFGMSGVVRLAGARLFADRSALQQAVFGTLGIYLACLTPLIGWFGLLPYTSWLGMGAFILSFFPGVGSQKIESG